MQPPSPVTQLFEQLVDLLEDACWQPDLVQLRTPGMYSPIERLEDFMKDIRRLCGMRKVRLLEGKIGFC